MNENYLTNTGMELSYSPFHDDRHHFRDPPPLPIDPWSIDAGNADRFVDDQGRGNYSGELIGPGVPGAGGSAFEAKVEALYQVHGPEMANAALQQDISLAMLDQAERLIGEMERQEILDPEDAALMREHVDLARAEVKRTPVTDAEGNILFEDLNGNGRFDAGSESPLMVNAEAKDDVKRWLGEDIDAIADAIGQQWSQELSDGDGGLFGGVLELPQEELAAIGRGEADNIGESGQDYGDNITVNNYYYGDAVTPDDIREDVERNGGRLGGDDGGGEVDVDDIMTIDDEVREENQKDGKGGTRNEVGNADNVGGGGGTAGADGGGGGGEHATEGTDGGGDGVGDSSESIDGGGETSSMATNNWLVILASALGKTSGKHLKAMLDTGKELGSVDSKENPEVFAQLNAEFSAESQIFKMFQEAISTCIKSIGEGMSSVARKN